MVTTTYLQTEKQHSRLLFHPPALRGGLREGPARWLQSTALFSLVRMGHSRMMAVDESMVDAQRVLLVLETAKREEKRKKRKSERSESQKEHRWGGSIVGGSRACGRLKASPED